jgi:AGZA family xanthine/uracil permease-like MFS transporter
VQLGPLTSRLTTDMNVSISDLVSPPLSIDPVFRAKLSQDETISPDEAFFIAYKVALAANFVTGLLSCVLGFFGPLILRVVPPAALLVPITGVSVAFLGLQQLVSCLAAPIVGFNTIFWVYLGWYAHVRVGVGKWRMPEALQVIFVGVMLGWATGLNSSELLRVSVQSVGWIGPVWSGPEVFENFELGQPFWGLILPWGITLPAMTLMCLVSAKEAGNPYPVRETMIVDGLGTMLASLFGSPFGTVVYIGHVAHKRSGAQVGYSFVTGIWFLLCSWFGILGLLQSIVNQATVGT